MSQAYCVPIETEHSTIGFDHELLAALRGRQLEVEVEQVYNVGTIRYGSEESSGYLMAKVSHLTAPLDAVDVVNAERTETWVCGCKGFHFNCYDEQIGAKIDDCKHTQKAKEQEREDLPDNQSTLIP